MKQNKLEILKQLLNGRISQSEALPELQKAVSGPIILIYGPNGYSIGNEEGLTETEMLARTRYASIIYRIPDNGRDPNTGNVL